MNERDRYSAEYSGLHSRVRCRIVLLTLLLIAGMLTSCGAPSPAPVVSREKPHPFALQQSLSPEQRLRRRPAYYRVRRGDTLTSIAWRFGLDYRALAEWNRIRKPYRIHPGRRLVLVKPKKAMAHNSMPPKPAAKPVKKNTKKEPPTVLRSEVKRGSSGIKRDRPQAGSQKKGKLKWQWPTNGSLSQHFAAGDPTRKGIRIVGKPGQRIVAAETGKVVYAGSGLIGYGLLIIIKHNNKYLSAYGYNRKIRVREGDQIKKGQAIAEMGAKGNGSAALHFEIRHNGAPVDPLKVLPP